MNSERLYQVVLKTLETIPLAEYENEERQLQPYLREKICNVLETSFPGKCGVKMSIGGKKRPRVDLFGTNFWPDMEVSMDGKPILAIEVKLAKKSLAAAISGTIGQCILYKLKYEHALGFIKNQARTSPQYNEYDGKLRDMLNGLKVPLIIRS